MLNTILYIVIGIVVAMLVFAFIKFPALRIVLGTTLGVVVVLTGVTSGIRLNTYYNEQGGIIGQITGIYSANQVETKEDEDISFTVKNVNFTKENENSKYSLKISSEKIIELNEDEYYTVKVNGEPCQILVSDKKSVKASYTYLFQDNHLDSENNYSEIAVDTMTISMSFYKNYSILIAEIDGNAEIAKLWESYFEKNNFSITISKVKDIDIVSSNLKTVTLKVNSEVFSKIKIKSGSNYILPENIEVDGYKFNYWELNNQRVLFLTNISSDTTVTANLTKKYNVILSMNIDEFDFNSNFISSKTYLSGSKIFNPEEPTREGFEFLGWSEDKQNLINLDEFTVTKNTTLYAMWQAKGYPIKVNSNGATYKIGNLEKTENFEFKSLLDYDITIEFINSNSNEEFLKYELYFGKVPVYKLEFKENKITFNLENILFNINKKYIKDPTEYDPENSTEYLEIDDVGTLNITILTVAKSETYTYENAIFKAFNINFSEEIGYVDLEQELEEREFLVTLYQSVTKQDATNVSNKEIKNLFLNIFEIDVPEDEMEFSIFLKTIYEAMKKN